MLQRTQEARPFRAAGVPMLSTSTLLASARLAGLVWLLDLAGCSGREQGQSPAPGLNDDSAEDGAEGPLPSSDGYADVADDPLEHLGIQKLAPSAPIAPPGWRAMAPFSTTGDDPPILHATVWTGTQLLIWGGTVWDQKHWTEGVPLTESRSNKGYAYDVAANAWSKLAPAPIYPHYNPRAAWTGKRMYIWGGADGSAPAELAAYTPETGAWTKAPPPPSPMAGGAEMVWSNPPGQPGRLLIWGASSCRVQNGTGMRYRPSTHTWSWMRKSPLRTRQGFRMIWTGTRMVVWGGYDCATGSQEFKDGASYDPVSNTWELLPSASSGVHPRRNHVLTWGAPSYPQLFLFGGEYTAPTSTSALRDGAAYNPATGRWTLIQPPPDSVYFPPRLNATQFWAGDRLWIWGGWLWGHQVNQELDSGATYSPASGWEQLPSGGPSPRTDAVGVWTGGEAIIWGGQVETKSPPGVRPLGDGKIFTP